MGIQLDSMILTENMLGEESHAVTISCLAA